MDAHRIEVKVGVDDNKGRIALDFGEAAPGPGVMVTMDLENATIFATSLVAAISRGLAELRLQRTWPSREEFGNMTPQEINRFFADRGLDIRVEEAEEEVPRVSWTPAIEREAKNA